ncbi:ABC transporter permease [Oceanobacillus halophilus]|uniref:ABC transporter permease n=1 Tax=Oceanobacillus halophilus TaxID=930130 RepID=A0A495AHF5_9BACI|nr:ABC transporter permease [Oceanobacillus halophilus]RKQ37965.1 ABC transporter permease [Oceanobacillus halophilus]
MIDIIKTRFIHWKKQRISLLFWLLFPMICTIFIIQLITAIQEDSQIPVGIVMEEDTVLANHLYAKIKNTPILRVVNVTETEAKQKVESHELDSAFVIQEDYEENIKKGKRNWLIKSYSSNLSFAFTPVKEMIISFVQEETGRSKTAHTVHDLSTDSEIKFSWEEVTKKAKNIQVEEDLLLTTFSFANTPNASKDPNITPVNTWGIWAVLSLLSTFLIFDWVIKERKSVLLLRYPFIRFSIKSFLLRNLLLYTMLLFFVDIITVILFHYVLNESLTLAGIGLLFMYRFMINLGAFLSGLMFHRLMSYYGFSFIITMFISILSGATVPIDGLTNRFPWIVIYNPLYSFLEQEWFNPWLLLLLLVVILWRIKGVKYNA